MNQETIKIRLLYVVLIPVFGIVSFLLSKIYPPHAQDFAAYWQAGYMILSKQDIYQSQTWIAEREALGTALHSEPTFQYPLPFAVLISPLGALPIDVAYMFWIFITQLIVLFSVASLLGSYSEYSANLLLIAVAGVYLFRATYITIFSGQILSIILLAIVLAIYLLQRRKQFVVGALLSILAFKPSLGLPILLLVGIWFLFSKRWYSLLGLIAGGLILFLIGAFVNPHWVIDYISIGASSFDKYYGMQATLWGMTGYFLKKDWSIWVNIGVVSFTLLISVYFLWKHRSINEPLFIFAFILPVALLTAPYSWAHDHFLLIIPIMYVFMNLVNLSGKWAGGIFLSGIVVLATGLVAIAYVIKLDVWSILIPSGVLFLVLYVHRKAVLEGMKLHPLQN